MLGRISMWFLQLINMPTNKINLTLTNILLTIVLGGGSWLGTICYTMIHDTHDIVITHTVKIDSLTARLNVVDSQINKMDAKADNWVTRQELSNKITQRLLGHSDTNMYYRQD